MIFIIFDTSQLKNMSDCKSINSVNPLYFLVSKANGHIEEKNGNKFIKIKTKKYLKKHRTLGCN